MVVWNGDSVVCRLGGFQNDMAAHLVHLRVLPFSVEIPAKPNAESGMNPNGIPG